MISLLDRVVERARTLSRYGVWFGGILIFAAAFIVGIEVVIRKAFNATIGGADELSGFALAISSAWAFGFALLERAHVRIDSIYTLLPARIGAVLDVLGIIVFTVFMALFAWQGLGVFTESVRMQSRTMTVLETPLMIPQFFWVLGLAAFVIIGSLLLVRAVVTLARGDFVGVQLQIGSKTVREELDDEIEQVVMHRSGTGGDGAEGDSR